jgi:hypothetical protein
MLVYALSSSPVNLSKNSRRLTSVDKFVMLSQVTIFNVSWIIL